MVRAKDKSSVGLGNALMNDRFGKGKGADRRKAGAVTRTNHATGEQYITNDREEAAWVKMRSVTEQGALDEFLSTAELAGTDFTAEKMNNVKIIHTDQKNPYLLSAAEERAVLGKHKTHKQRLTVPRRPKWDETTTPEQLDAMEREAFLNWRRGLAELAESHDLLMTPFERNLEVWRQLWRVIERSDLVVQIVDARNPLLFRSEDLDHYVKSVDPKKENLLLINKADMMTLKQRQEWARYLKGAKIAFNFFSASYAKELNEARDLESGSEEDEAEESTAADGGAKLNPDALVPQSAEKEESGGQKTEESSSEEEDFDTRIITVEELESIFLKHAPESSDPKHKMQVGLVGYPNVGKSSTINALIGAKKVSVSSTPGKTKHFQTIHLSDKVVLCDCPGLVFPNFASTKADLVCNGVLPIDELREFTGPAALVARRIPKAYLEAVYGITIKTRPAEEGGTGVPTAEELLVAYARARGFTKTGNASPDESKAARHILKDYVNGKLLYCEPPPTFESDAVDFNNELYIVANLPEKRRLAVTAALDAMSISAGDTVSLAGTDILALPQGPKSQKLDKTFFGTGRNAGHLNRPFNYKYTEQGMASGKQLSGRKAREMAAIENNIDPKDARLMSGKKHFKGGQKPKANRRLNKDDED
ncbi:hypothetical protein PpBr36_02436 [Pyricularia pennisetigena]|uniref:hypothetical protein n=1 Tax=Pyricularia pennisetigena TaxID=1578925 RepID=UPI0011517025|nr:hypothetical protein PpBr36_02436 [Pyricularia pennisetigena]TLS31248.1 hypothetical protein PpBr36_02436 [Pyricularia pennisetigena]